MTVYLVCIIFPLILGIWAQMQVHSKYSKWSRVLSKGKITGAEAAQAVMEQAGIHNVEIVAIGGSLTDHYDPVHRQLALSKENYYGTSLAALGVAAHEAGHAIQHKQAYAPLQLRSALICYKHRLSDVAMDYHWWILFGDFWSNKSCCLDIPYFGYFSTRNVTGRI